MVVNNPIERVGPGQVDYLLNRLANLERRLDQGGARSSFPFSVGHLGVTDFQIIPSTSGDGSADIYIGNGAGGKLLQVTTDTQYGTKILRLLDQNGSTMLSTDALAGYGLGTPSLPFVYAGFESTNLSGATSQATGREMGRGVNYVYNPAVFINPRVRLFSATAETVKIFMTWRDAQGNLANTADITVNLAANLATIPTCQFGHLWDADDMNFPCAAFVKAYCTSANPANVNVTASYQDGYGVSKKKYDDNAGSVWTV
jgi:hypothetical protein